MWTFATRMDLRCVPWASSRIRKRVKGKMALSGRKENKNLIVGLDIGTSKIAAIVAEMKTEGGFEVVGMGSSPSRGLKKGVVVNIESTVNAIQRALEEAELMADCK